MREDGAMKCLPLLVAALAGVGSLLAQPARPGPGEPAAPVDAHWLALPTVGQGELRILSPSMLEVSFITAPAEGAIPPPINLSAKADYQVTVDDKPVPVAAIGFKRRVAYAPLKRRDLRVGNYVYLQFAEPLDASRPHTITVKNAASQLWPADAVFRATSDPLRYSPVIHVNQEGYATKFPKIAMVGYYTGNLGELYTPQSDFEVIEAKSGTSVFKGRLLARRDQGYSYTPVPYQRVWEANFSELKKPGEYRLVVPGLGASLPFRINDSELMNFVRAYALGLYHQRCGCTNEMPFTRFTHDACHLAPAEVPIPSSSFSKAWGFIARANQDQKKPDHPAKMLKDEDSQLYPFVRRDRIDAAGGHHDAGDYSKYTNNSAGLIHALMFAVDAFPGVAALDNLGLPESGDGVSDLLQEAKWEADFLAKIQDSDGGFYFLVYPKERAYESGLMPDRGDPQIVWPKNTAATAAAVAALAQCASSPEFQRRYPSDARRYLEQAKRGWKFLEAAIAKHGKAGAYQKLTHYGDNFRHDDELAWAAAEMFVATGDPKIGEKLLEWYPDPNNGDTHQWGWWHAAFSWGNALRAYAFAARSGRLKVEQLDAGYLARCEAELRRAGNDALKWSEQSAYGTSFPEATKRQRAGGWYFSSDQAFDLTVAYQLDPRPTYAEAVIANLNFEAGTNPNNVSFITGLGDRRQREIVHQYAQSDRRVLPPTGIPLGSLQASFDYVGLYKNALRELSFPLDDAKLSPYPLYDRWSDAYNVTTEFVITNQARSLGSLAFWAAQAPGHDQPWKAARGQIQAPVSTKGDQPLTFKLLAPDVDLTGARIVWEARDSEPVIGDTFTFTAKNTGAQWVEAEAQLPDGRRVFAANNFTVSRPIVYWLDGEIPAGAYTTTTGGDKWEWIQGGTKPLEMAGRNTPQHASTGTEPLHEHTFTEAEAGLPIEAGDVLFAWVNLDPQNPPKEIMLSFNDGSWEHRAFWGADLISYGRANSPGRRSMGALPKPGEWTRLEIPAKALELEGKSIRGMSFSVHSGKAIWDAAGKFSKSNDAK
jgi:hypothetical protein